MKGIILAGGTGSRLYPLTKITNKHLLPIYNKPMIYYPLQTLITAGIRDILIVSGRGHAGHFVNLLGSGKEFGVRISYEVQEEAGGIPQAIGLAEDFIGNEKFISINGDNILLGSIKKYAAEFQKGDEEARILLYKATSEEAKKAGVAVLEGDGVKEIIEKPRNPPTNWVSTGVYMLSPSVFGLIKKLKPSKRGELEIADIQNHYIKKGTLKADKLDYMWMDAGSFDELLRANNIVAQLSGKP